MFLLSFITTALLSYLLAASSSEDLTKASWNIPENIDLLDISDRLIGLTQNKTCKALLESGKRKIYLFTYPSGNLQVKGYVSIAPEKKSRAPILFFLRGGNRWFGLMNPANEYSCYGDYTVIGLSYRGSVSPGIDEFGGEDVADVANLVKYFPTLHKRIGISQLSRRYLLGVSRGGMQMFLTLNRYPEIQSQFTAVMSISGPLHLSSWIKTRPDIKEMFLKDFGLSDKNEKQWLSHRDPSVNLDNLSRDLRIIIVQGSKDDRVDVKNGKEMLANLIDQGFCFVTYREITDATHTLNNRKDDQAIIWRLFEEE